MGCGCTSTEGGNTPSGGGDVYAFRYTADGTEGSDFFITFPVARTSDGYFITCTSSGVAELLVIDLPDLDAADRTTTEFRMVTSADVQDGDQFDFHVVTP